MISNYLKNILSNRNLSIYRLSKISGIGDGRLNQIINNKTKSPQIQTVVKIAKALDLNEYEFAEDVTEEKDKFQTEYHKYLVPVSVKADARAEETYTFAFDAKAAKDVNFNSALSQWAVKGFDCKYTFTLVNRETAQEITLGLQESDVKGEYKVVNAVDENKEAVSFASLKKAATGEEA